MTKNELIKQCRYYKGEERCPYKRGEHDKSLMWDYERRWVNDLASGKTSFYTEALELYKNYGLENFNNDDGVPLTLKVLLFTRFMHWSGGYGAEYDREAFKQFYFQTYIDQ